MTSTSTSRVVLAPRAVSREWPLLLNLTLAALLILPGLGRDYLWQDEGDTAVLARGILQKGLPVAWDGQMLAVPDFGQRLTPDLVMVSHPWLQYYMAAASFGVLGETPFAARLPFALAGLALIVVVYWMALDLLASRRTAAISAFLLVLNVQFLLYSRQARNYTIHALLTCLLLWLFYRLNSPRRAVLFTILGLLLFHAHPLALVVLAMLGLLTLVARPFRAQRRWFWPPAGTIVAYAIPWLAASRAGYVENSAFLADANRFVPRSLQFIVEWASVTPLVGIAVLAGVLILRSRRPSDSTRGGRAARARSDAAPLFMPGEFALLAMAGAVAFGCVIAMAITQSRDMIWIVGLRYTSALIPLSAMVAALLIMKVSRENRRLFVALVLVFGFTKFGRLTPYVLWDEPEPLRRADAVVGFHVPTRAIDGVLRTGQVRHVASLFDSRPGVIAGITEYLRAHAAPGDLVVTNFAWEAVYFHTRLPQAMKVNERFPIYRRVRGRLPDYLFSPQGARWIVWRRVWGDLWAQDCERILLNLKRAGIPVHLVATIPETYYENRENLHFHRFGKDYIYPWFDDLPPALIFRVDWPSEVSRSRGTR